MSDISNQLIKDSYNYVLQSDLNTGIVYRIGGGVPVNPIFQSGLTISSGFTFNNGTEQPGYVLTSDSFGNATWEPLSDPSSYNFLSLSGGTVTGDTTFTKNVFVNTISATTYQNLPSLSGNYLPLSGGTVSGDTIFLGGVSANTFNVNTIGSVTDCVGDLFVSNLHGCVTGVTLHNDIVPVTNETIDLGTPIKRFREINTLSGVSSYWVSTVKVTTPEVDLGIDVNGNSRKITANNSIIQEDILNGGVY